MNPINTATIDRLVTRLEKCLAGILFAYVFSMLIYPFVKASGDWTYVQNVWDRWQSLNAGILALSASIIGFYISRYNQNKKRERDFVAARAFLPLTLSELTSYCKSCSVLLREAYVALDRQDGLRLNLESELEELPDSLKETFSRCISVADPDIGGHLAQILWKLQINNSRLKELKIKPGQGIDQMIFKNNLVSYLFSLGELQTLIFRTFNFARALESLNNSNLNWDDYTNAYFNLDIELDDIEGLEEFTKRVIARGG